MTNANTCPCCDAATDSPVCDDCKRSIRGTRTHRVACRCVDCARIGGISRLLARRDYAAETAAEFGDRVARGRAAWAHVNTLY